MFYTIHYKKYKGSQRATLISFFSGLLTLIATASVIAFIAMIIRYKTENIKDTIIAGVVFAISLILAKLSGKYAEKIGQADFEKRIREDLRFAISMAKDNPEAKSLYMQLNPQYANYLLSQGQAILTEDRTIKVINSMPKTSLEKNEKPINLAKTIPIVLLAIVLSLCFIYFLSHNILNNSSTSTTNKNSINSTSAGDDSKYPTYVKLNNDMSWRYLASVTAYVDEFGQDETIVFRHGKNDISGITPVLDSFYKDLDDFKEKVQKSPKTDVDESALKFIDETKIMYDTIGEVAAYYNDGEYKADNLARAQEIHTKYINEIKKWSSDYSEFSKKLGPMSIRIMNKDLDKYKNNGQNYEYYSLKLLADSKAMKKYMSDNSIDDTNIFSMDTNDYKTYLNTLNETYSQYKIYSESKSGSIHLEALKSDAETFVESANSISRLVENKDVNSKIVHKPGVLYEGDNAISVNDLDIYLERMISDYNSSVSFDYNNKINEIINIY